MTAFTSISNALLAVGAKPFATTVQAFRDNLLSTLEGDASAPVNQLVWHPYNKVTNGDTNDGKFYDVAVSGATGTVTTPDFVDGFEYRIRVNVCSSSAGSVGVPINLQFALYRETDAAYDTFVNILTGVQSPAVTVSGIIEILKPRQTDTWCPWHAVVAPTNTGGVPSQTRIEIMSVANGQKRLRGRLQWTGGNIDQGQFYLDRRRLII